MTYILGLSKPYCSTFVAKYMDVHEVMEARQCTANTIAIALALEKKLNVGVGQQKDA